MNENGSAHLSKSDIEILNEFEGIDREIAAKLLSYRQPASPALRRRITDITRTTERTMLAPISLGVLRRVLAVTLISILILMLPFALPQVRAFAAQIFLLMQTDTITDVVSPGPTSYVILSPTPKFTVRQPGSLPDGFTRTAVHYHSHIPMLITEQVSDASSNPALASRLEAYDTDSPHLLIAYQASDQRYFLLFQRAVSKNELLPAGTSLTINDHPASLYTKNNILILTWIADDTWITLETNTSKSNVLETARGLSVTQQPENDPTASVAANLPLCDSENLMLRRHLLGEVDDQIFWGSLWIYLYERDDSPESVAFSTDAEGVTEAMLYQRGLDALHDPRLAGQALSAAPDAVFEASSDQQCLEPDSELSGYVVLEIWEQQVNAAFVGTGSELRERAINALENKLAK